MAVICALMVMELPKLNLQLTRSVFVSNAYLPTLRYEALLFLVCVQAELPHPWNCEPILRHGCHCDHLH